MNALRFAVLSLLVAAPCLAAASGKVVDPDGRPVSGAEVCVVAHGAASDCRTTDNFGFYHLPNPASMTLFIHASGFQPATVAAIEQSASIVLKRAAILKVIVLDAATHRPVPRGRVILNYSSGQQVGSSAPFNAKGVRITTLAPGDLLVRAEAEGYEPGGPEAVALAEGRESSVALSMKKSAPAPAR